MQDFAQDDASRGDIRVVAHVRHLAGVRMEIETLVEIGGKGRHGVGGYFHSTGPFYSSNCNNTSAAKWLPLS